MASNTARSEKRRARTHQKAGKRRKAAQSQRSTLTAVELFASLGEPGKPAPKAKPVAAAR
jgi:hypothetical protein